MSIRSLLAGLFVGIAVLTSGNAARPSEPVARERVPLIRVVVTLRHEHDRPPTPDRVKQLQDRFLASITDKDIEVDRRMTMLPQLVIRIPASSLYDIERHPLVSSIAVDSLVSPNMAR